MRHLHPLDGVRGGVGPVDEMRVLHVLRQPLQEAQRFVKYHRHGDLGQLLQKREGRKKGDCNLISSNLIIRRAGCNFSCIYVNGTAGNPKS